MRDEESSTGGSLLMVAIGLAFVLAGAGAGYIQYSTYQEVQKINANVETADGTVTSTEMRTEVERDDDETETEYFPQATYEYTVGGETYTGNHIFAEVERDSGADEPPGREFDSRSEAEEMMPDGDEVTVYYFPDEPERSFLVRPTTGLGNLAGGLAVGLVFVLVGLGVAYGGLTGDRSEGGD